MRKFDILSQSPTNYIFQKESNKTTFGGFLSILFILIIALIFLMYRFQFWFHFLYWERYEITSYVSQEKTLKENQRDKFTQSIYYNPSLLLNFSLSNSNDDTLSDRFIFFDYRKKKYFKSGEIIERRVSEIGFFILYKCNNTNETNCEVDEKDFSPFYYLTIGYQGFRINFRGSNPITQLEKNEFHTNFITFNPNLIYSNDFIWKIIRCEDYKPLDVLFEYLSNGKEDDEIREKNIFIGGKLEISDKSILSKDPNNIKGYRLMMDFTVSNANNTNAFLYEDYKRKEIGYFDNFPDIFALWITVYNIFTFLFTKIYSTSFDKYQIIDNILSKQKGDLLRNKRHKSQISIINDIKQDDILFENVTEMETKEQNLINNFNSNKNEEIDDSNNLTENKDKQKRVLPGRCCCDFIDNYFCGGICCCLERQKLIYNCKGIVLNYFSVENIIYSQIMLENLLKDYKWNDPELKKILNNDSFRFINYSLNK